MLGNLNLLCIEADFKFQYLCYVCVCVCTLFFKKLIFVFGKFDFHKTT